MTRSQLLLIAVHVAACIATVGGFAWIMLQPRDCPPPDGCAYGTLGFMFAGPPIAAGILADAVLVIAGLIAWRLGSRYLLLIADLPPVALFLALVLLDGPGIVEAMAPRPEFWLGPSLFVLGFGAALIVPPPPPPARRRV
jgi:hypothetical protein